MPLLSKLSFSSAVHIGALPARSNLNGIVTRFPLIFSPGHSLPLQRIATKSIVLASIGRRDLTFDAT